MYKKIIIPIIASFILILCTGCPPKIAIEEYRILDVEEKDSLLIEALDPIIQKNDILYINISVPGSESLQRLAALVNGINSTGGSTPSTFGYLVNPFGKITLPQLGEISVAGKRKQQVIEEITKLVNLQFKGAPTVNMRIVNFRVFVEGEVNRPGAYEISNELITLPQAITLAGGFTIFAVKSQIKLIRDDNGKKSIVRLDMRKGDLFDKDKEYYYLKQNDQIIVDVNKEKPLSANQSSARNLSLAATAMTVLITLFTLLKN